MTDYHQVKFHPTAKLSPYCSIVGDVEIAQGVSVFAGTHIRGDGEPVKIGAGSNIQENCCLHVSGGYPITIGERVTVGHGAILHGCTIHDNVLVGMGAIVMDGAEISSDCFVGAGALVTQGKTFPPRSLIFGSPARAMRKLTDEELESMVTLAAPDYSEVSDAMLADGLMVHPSETARIWPE
ncbi:MAG: gamma carbonic anhydrase family protein [Eggerthellaceae bacterium]|nr:gamma carbonic anhydrase family protein [Eggerthellaceae bacterium]